MASAGPQQKHAALRRLHHSAEEGSRERAIGAFLESTSFEMFIIFLVLCDVVLLGLEHGIDRHMLCIGGRVAPMAPNPLVSLAKGQADAHPHFFQLPDVGEDGRQDWMLVPGHALRQRRLSPAADFSAIAVAESTMWSPGPVALLQQGARSRLDPDAHGSQGSHDTHGAHGKHDSRIIAKPHDDESGHSHHVAAALVCETRNGPQAHDWQHFCHTASIVILSIFLVEIMLKLWLHTDEFLHNPFEVLDLVVVTVSLIVDLFVAPMIHNTNAKVNVSRMLFLLVVCRVWRLVRIVHGSFEVVHHQVEKVEHLQERIAELEHEISEKRKS